MIYTPGSFYFGLARLIYDPGFLIFKICTSHYFPTNECTSFLLNRLIYNGRMFDEQSRALMFEKFKSIKISRFSLFLYFIRSVFECLKSASLIFELGNATKNGSLCLIYSHYANYRHWSFLHMNKETHISRACKYDSVSTFSISKSSIYRQHNPPTTTQLFHSYTFNETCMSDHFGYTGSR